ncbi:MAG TPA: phage portal protein [Terracidiphilus sp.]|nr:phage portal protein [Terracidiphilus sp.]
MGILQRVGRAFTNLRASIENPSVPLSLASFLAWLGTGEPTASGEIINVASAMQITTVYACVRGIAEGCALPLVVEEIRDDGSRERVDHDLAWTLNNAPNDEMNGATFWESYFGNMAAAGNAYAEILRDNYGRAAGVYPLSSHSTRPRRNESSGKLEFVTKVDNRERVIQSDDMLFNPLFCFDGLMGLNPIAQARQMLGLARATEKFGARFFGNGAYPGGILSPEPGNIVDDKQKANLKESWERNYGGDNARRVAVMTAPWKWQAIGITPEDSQFIGTQQFTRTQIAALFNMPPHKVGDTSRLSNNNHEQQQLSFVTDTLRPYLNRAEKELTRKLLPTAGSKAYRLAIRFDVSERLRGDFTTMQEGYALGRQWGWLSANDVRRDMGMQPIGAEGDIFLSPLNMLDARAVESTPAPQPAKSKQLGEGETEGTDAERSMLGRYAQNHARGFVQAFRLAGGDLEQLRQGLAPAIRGIADEAAREHAFTFWPDGAQERIAGDAIDGVVRRMRRAGLATIGVSEQLCRDEFRRVVRAVHINTARESAAITAEAQVGQEV